MAVISPGCMAVGSADLVAYVAQNYERPEVQRAPADPLSLSFIGAVPTRGAMTSAQPIGQVTRSVEGAMSIGYKADLYGRVHVIPQRVDVGNLLSAQTYPVEVWNAHLEPKLLQEVQGLGQEGVVLVQPVDAPTTFGATESREYSVSVSVAGPPVVSATYVFVFELGESLGLEVSGRRVVVWPFVPQRRFREVLEWATTVAQARSKERRSGARAVPRQIVNFTYQLDEQQFSRAKAIATGWAHRTFGMPVWWDCTRVGGLAAGAPYIDVDTSNADYRSNDVVLVWEDDEAFEAAETLTVEAGRINLKLPLTRDYSNAYVMPLRFGRVLRGMDFRRRATPIVESGVEFTVVDTLDRSATDLPQYRGKDVLTDRTVLVGDVTERIERAVTLLDNGSGVIVADPETTYPTQRSVVGWSADDRAAAWRLRCLLHARKGRLKSFWLPSWNVDLVLTKVVSAAAQGLTVRNVGYHLYYGVTDIMIRTTSGQTFFRRVLGGSLTDQGENSLSIDAALGVELQPSDVEFICFMRLVRFDSDRVELTHKDAGVVETSVPVMEVPE